jgi:hypothetical protein
MRLAKRVEDPRRLYGPEGTDSTRLPAIVDGESKPKKPEARVAVAGGLAVGSHSQSGWHKKHGVVTPPESGVVTPCDPEDTEPYEHTGFGD